MSVRIDTKTFGDLDWGRLLAALAQRCTGPAARRGVSSGELAVPVSSVEEARRSLAESAEALTLLTDGEPLPLDGLREVALALDRVERGGDLDVAALRDVLSTLNAARVLRRFLGARRERLPALFARCSTDPSLDEMADSIARLFDPDGTIADRASPELGQLRSEIAGLRRRITARLDEMLDRHAAVMQDRYYTQRDGRYVLPVRTDAHERVHGIVHATSSSGATVFVEPRALVPLGNRLKVAEAAAEREIARILAAVSASVRDRIHELRAAADALDHADLKHASATLAHDLEARFPEIVAEPAIALRVARHPLLVLDGVAVVPADIDLSGGHALVISGPNAGGKTVALKTMGLAALSVRCGLPVAAAPGSTVGFFDEVWTDMGDEQSLSANLSTFSAHMSRVAAMLETAGHGSLVLLDEPGAGTDPEQGAAVAAAIVDELCRAGAAVAVATHFEALKALGARDPRMRNASVGFDFERMVPTFVFVDGVPGVSSALAVAQRYGVPARVVERAQGFLTPGSRSFDDLIARLQEERAGLADARSRAQDEAREAARVREALEADLAKARARERDRLSAEGEALMRDLSRARDELKAARARLRGAKLSAQDVDASAAVLSQVTSATSGDGPLAHATTPQAPPPEERGQPVSSGELKPGARVYVPRLRAEAEVLSVQDGDRLRVAVGPLKLQVGVAEVRLLAARAPRPQERPRAVATRGRRRDATPLRTQDNTCDVRGMRADEAITAVETFLDRLYGADVDAAFVLHGHGTGALREAVRGRLDGSRYVAEWRPGNQDDGGEAVTVIFLK